MRSADVTKTVVLIAFAALGACRQATPAEVGAQSIRDAQPMALIAASERASAVSPNVVPESAKGGAIQQAPSHIPNVD